MGKAGKNDNVETLRGIAIILVVAGHVIGIDSNGGMKVGDDSLYRYFYYTFQYLRLPLFTVISGWVYDLHPVSRESLTVFVKKKIRRIIIPLVFVGGLYYIVRYFVPGTNFKEPLADIWKILFFPYTIYWYLPALFILFCLIGIIDSFKLIKTKTGWISFFVFSVLLFLVYQMPYCQVLTNYFSYKGAINLLPFFILGIFIHRYNEVFFELKIIQIIAGTILLICLFVQQYLWWDGSFQLSDYSTLLLGFTIGIAFNILVFQAKWSIAPLMYIANYAYTIYLFHAFGTSAGRIILKGIGIYSGLTIFFFSLLIALFFPIVVDRLFSKFKLTRALFLGRK